ncbi:helix-turn-helix domain-containing protein [Actinomadura hibisca]|uniref:helix-turn-helix domain-containing protein n=1 Tax=Actinomadura hibisca TaxID=68565 RepID=UPI000A02088C|nr:helix-turn-helix domain-containing protein [Actinomadura hibisca]
MESTRKEIGQRIARARRSRGLSQIVLAGLVGRSESRLSQVERGVRNIDSHSVLTHLAEVLGLPVDDLIANETGGGVKRYQAAELIRNAMTRYDTLPAIIAPDSAQARPPDLNWLSHELRAVNRLYQATHYDAAGQRLPGLITAVEQAAHAVPTRQRRTAHTLRALIYHSVATTLNRVAETELAWTAADRSVSAARDADNPLLAAVSAYRLGYVFIRMREPEKAKILALQAAAALGPVLTKPNPQRLSLWGGLHLVAVIAAARQFDRAEVDANLEQAQRAADALGSDRNHFWTAFGPTNVRIHELSAAVTFGDPRRAVDVGESLDVTRLAPGLRGRRTQVRLDLARAYGQQRKDAAAVNVLVEAENISPELVRYDPRTHDLLTALMKREHRAGTPQLRGLAHRAGVI